MTKLNCIRMLLVGQPGTELFTAAEMARGAGAEVVMADTPSQALMTLRTSATGLVMIDVELDVAGFMARLRAERFAVPVLACGIDASAAQAVAAIRAGPSRPVVRRRRGGGARPARRREPPRGREARRVRRCREAEPCHRGLPGWLASGRGRSARSSDAGRSSAAWFAPSRPTRCPERCACRRARGGASPYRLPAPTWRRPAPASKRWEARRSAAASSQAS